MVHTSPKNMGFVCGGAQTVIEALLETVIQSSVIHENNNGCNNHQYDRYKD